MALGAGHQCQPSSLCARATRRPIGPRGAGGNGGPLPGGNAGSPAFPPGKGPPLPPAPLGPMGRRVARAHNELGWHWWPAPNAIATRPYKNLRPCTQRATCMWGCVEGAKGSVDITHWPTNVERGVHLVTGARVRRLETNGSALVAGAVYVDREGKEHFQKAAV